VPHGRELRSVVASFAAEPRTENVAAFWEAVEQLGSLAAPDCAQAIDELTDDPDVPLWAVLIVYQSVWTAVLARNPPDLRRLLLPWHEIEMRAIAEGAIAATASCKRTCSFLQEIDDDDLNWTGFRLPGEEP
jgi:hypothetical protein